MVMNIFPACKTLIFIIIVYILTNNILIITIDANQPDNDSINENYRGRIKMDIFIGIQTKPLLRESLSFIIGSLRVLTTEFEIAADLTTVCVYAYNIDDNKENKCANNSTDYVSLLNKITTTNSLTNPILATTDEIFQKFASILTIPSTRPRTAIMISGGQDVQNIQVLLKVWTVYANMLKANNVTLILIETEQGEQEEIETNLYKKMAQLGVIGEDDVLVRNNQTDLNAILPAYTRIKTIHACDVYYPKCFYSDPQQTDCIADWWRLHVHLEERCQNNVGRGTPPIRQSIPPVLCDNRTKCERFCRLWVKRWPVYNPDCRIQCGETSGPIKNNYMGLWYAQLNCPINRPMDECPPCITATAPLSTNSKQLVNESQNVITSNWLVVVVICAIVSLK